MSAPTTTCLLNVPLGERLPEAALVGANVTLRKGQELVLLNRVKRLQNGSFIGAIYGFMFGTNPSPLVHFEGMTAATKSLSKNGMSWARSSRNKGTATGAATPALRTQ